MSVGKVHHVQGGSHVPYIPKLTIERIHPNAVLPKYASEGDSGMDVYATSDMLIRPMETKLAKLGLLMEIPPHPFHELGYRWEVQARPRSGVSLKTMVRVANAPGTIDNFYRNELGIILTNSVAPAWEYGSTSNDPEDTREDLYVKDSRLAETLDGKQFDLWALTDTERVELGFMVWERRLTVPEGTYFVRKGDRIAQLVIAEVIRPLEIEEGKVNTDLTRGGGFGSTGK